jgi:peptide/nickel transport system substrate-binding protein
VATEWKIAADGLTYTFKLRQGIRFHDGSTLTAADVKATYEKIVFPPAGVNLSTPGGCVPGRNLSKIRGCV